MCRREVKLKPGMLQQLEKELDTNQTGLAAITGLSPSQIYRVHKGKSKVGADFIAAVLKADSSRRFEDYFTID